MNYYSLFSLKNANIKGVYMNPEPIESLMPRILNRYNRKPSGWMVLTDSHRNVLVLGPKIGYRLKLVQLNPRQFTGVGVKIKNTRRIRKQVEGGPSYGFRPLSSSAVEQLIVSGDSGRIPNELLNDFFNLSPVPLGDINKTRPKAILSGPVLVHPNLNVLSTSQKKLEAKLSLEADKLFRTKYSYRADMYR